MTKPEQEETDSCDVQRILLETMVEANSRGRVTCGLYETAETLEQNTSLSGICVLSKEELENPDFDGLLFMMETFCLENDIPIIKVNNVKRLAEETGLKPCDENGGEQLNCILIQIHNTRARRSRPNKKIDDLLKICDHYEREGKQIFVDME
eukprot:Seg1905.5 transcript_id=Seg1905.5/GoldUCD/mRNA.D3Y31 product="Growth arrest and DNA damage-inducible protein GADD45 gamma" protein_id=Seg1905.5/GoldUCD/D3Y31